jgi:hypothetical protein
MNNVSMKSNGVRLEEGRNENETNLKRVTKGLIKVTMCWVAARALGYNAGVYWVTVRSLLAKKRTAECIFPKRKQQYLTSKMQIKNRMQKEVC